MQNLDSYKQKPRSISRTLSAGLIITLVLVAGLSLGVNFILSARKAKAELETRADEYISALTDALKVPLWNYSEETIAATCASYAQNEFVAKLLLKDQKGAALFKKEKVDQRLVVSRSRDIFYEGNLIGHVQIALTSGYYTAVNRQLFQSVSLTIVIMIGALLVMTGVLLRQLLKKPISRFIKMVDAYAAGEPDAFKQGTPYREFRPLLDVLNKMGEKIASQKQDITEQKKAEQALMESRAKYRDLVENANCIIFQMDTRGNITFFNRFAQEFFGYSEAEILGRNVVGTIAPATESTGRNLQFMIEDLVKHPERYADNENENIRRNGELVWVAWTNRAIYDNENRLSEILCFGIDRTAQKRADEIVKNSEQRLAQIINFLPDPTWVIDNEGKVVTWNQAMENLTGIAAADMVGKGNYEYALPFYGERRPILIDLVREWNPEYEKKYLSIKKDGNKLFSESHHPHLGDGGLYLSGNASLIYDAAGQVAGAIETLRDITERKHMEEDLRRNVEELERFNKLATGREIKMIQLKEEINELLCQSNRDKRYKIVK
jgi:PAS domain S-box-containing protein